jgi:hypothetical protein
VTGRFLVLRQGYKEAFAEVVARCDTAAEALLRRDEEGEGVGVRCVILDTAHPEFSQLQPRDRGPWRLVNADDKRPWTEGAESCFDTKEAATQALLDAYGLDLMSDTEYDIYWRTHSDCAADREV